jgi:hypothetical protein
MKQSPYQILSEALLTPYRVEKKEEIIAAPTKTGFNEVAMRQLIRQMSGSLVASRSLDEQQNWGKLCFRNDVQQLNGAFRKVRDISSEVTLKATNERLTKGATSKGFTSEFSSARPSDEARALAKIANELTQPAAEMINGTGWAGGAIDFLEGQDRPRTIGDISSQLGRYCNLPIHLSFDKKRNLDTLSVMSPFGWVINSDASFRWKKGEKAYYQFDPATWEIDKSYFPENIVWCSANHDPDQRYGFPFAYNLAVHVETLQKLFAGLGDARTAGNPQTYIIAEGRDGGGYDFEEYMKLLESMPEELMARGVDLGPLSNFFFRVLNGKADVKTVTAGTGFFTEFGDADLLRQMIAVCYNLQAALIFGAEKANRATLEFLMRLESAAQRLWALQLTLSLIFPVYKRVLYMASIDTRLIRCDVKWNEEKTPEEMAAESAFAKECWQDDLIAKKSAHEKACSYLTIDPKVDEDRQREEKLSGIKTPKENRANIRMSGFNPLIKLPGSDIQSQINSDIERIN